MTSTPLLLLQQFPIDPGWLTAWCALLLGIAGSILLWRSRRPLVGTTLVAPWGWTLFAWVGLSMVEAAIGVSHSLAWPIADDHWRFVAAMGLFCPQVSQMGAKWPQNRICQAMVLLFWLMLCAPVVQAWLFDGSGHIAPGWVWGSFLALLIVAGLLNNGPTRYAPTAFCLATAQTIMTYPYLPWATAQLSPAAVLAALVILLIGIGLVVCGWPGRSTVLRAEDRAWLDFRDSFGAFWAARVMHRVNESAVRFDWGLWLTWNGFIQVEIAGSHPEFRDELREGLCVCLRRLFGDFVDEAWLDARLPRPRKRKTCLEDIEA